MLKVKFISVQDKWRMRPAGTNREGDFLNREGE